MTSADDRYRRFAITCPFHGNAGWRWVRDHDPDGWAEAIEFDRAIRYGYPHATKESKLLQPGGFDSDRRFAKPFVLALDDIAALLVFLGEVDTPDPVSSAAAVTETALSRLDPIARAVCRRLVVAWTDGSGQGRASAFAVTPGGAGKPLAWSWIPSESWPAPMSDVTRPVAAPVMRRWPTWRPPVRRVRNVAGTGQIHLWFDRTRGGWPPSP